MDAQWAPGTVLGLGLCQWCRGKVPVLTVTHTASRRDRQDKQHIVEKVIASLKALRAPWEIEWSK